LSPARPPHLRDDWRPGSRSAGAGCRGWTRVRRSRPRHRSSPRGLVQFMEPRKLPADPLRHVDCQPIAADLMANRSPMPPPCPPPTETLFLDEKGKWRKVSILASPAL
jgi:hypothetical protein